jgi:UDP-N-acetylglucosamine 2-epimerase (non-hydrolysing)
MSREPYGFDEDESLRTIDFEHRRVVLLTCHRREVLGEIMYGIFSAVKDLLEAFPDVEIVFPIHKNPAVRSIYASVGIDDPRMHLLEPMEYKAFIHVMKRSALIITDSGGIQEEAPYFGIPVIVVRDVTERMEAVEAGTVVLAGTGREEVFRQTAALLSNPEKYQAMSRAVNPYGDGFACRRIVQGIDYRLGVSSRYPEEFGRAK